jgi:hypothetical protein
MSFQSYLPLIRLLKISLVGVADFAVGVTLATLFDQAFGQLAKYEMKQHPFTSQTEPEGGPIPYYNLTQLKYIGLVSLAQLIVTLVTGLEVRNLFVPYESFFDPTGGIVFVLALFFQPGLWLRSRLILQSIYEMLWQFGKPESEKNNS